MDAFKRKERDQENERMHKHLVLKSFRKGEICYSLRRRRKGMRKTASGAETI